MKSFLAGRCYNLAGSREKMSGRRKFIEGLCCLWFVGAQVWYYSQFAELLRNALKPLLGNLWR